MDAHAQRRSQGTTHRDQDLARGKVPVQEATGAEAHDGCLRGAPAIGGGLKAAAPKGRLHVRVQVSQQVSTPAPPPFPSCVQFAASAWCVSVPCRQEAGRHAAEVDNRGYPVPRTCHMSCFNTAGSRDSVLAPSTHAYELSVKQAHKPRPSAQALLGRPLRRYYIHPRHAAQPLPPPVVYDTDKCILELTSLGTCSQRIGNTLCKVGHSGRRDSSSCGRQDTTLALHAAR